MTTRTCSVVVVMCLCIAPRLARAALYEFTLQGQVTEVFFWPNVAVGDPFTIRYTADTADQDPAALLGTFSASRALVTLPNTTITAGGGVNRVRVLLDTPTMTQRVVYESPIPNYQFSADFNFPGGTLAGDGLPLTLPLSSATTATWRVYDFGPQVRGNLTSYSSALVPEPSVLWLLALAGPPGRRRRCLRG